MNEYLNQIEISGITYDLVASGGTESGVTPAEVQEMINQSISGMSGDINIISGDVKNISGDVITISGDVISLSRDVKTISGDVITLSGDVIALETKLDTLSGNVYTKSETSGKTELDTEFGKYYKKTETSSKTEIDDALNQKQDILIAGSGISIVNNVISASGGGITSGEVMDIVSGYTYDKDTIDDKIASGGTFDPTLYYKKSETSGKTELSTEFEKYYKKTETSGKTEIQNALDLKLDASAFTESDYYKKSETSGKTELDTEFAKYYKKDETSGKTELADEFDKYYKKSETSSKTEIDDAFSAITKVIEDNEKVVARALNDLNNRKVESGDVIDIVSGYTYSKAVIDDALDDKQDKLVSGTNIKTINGESLLGSGNITISGGGGTYTAGRGINISGDVISFNLPISAGTGTNSVAEGNSVADGDYSHAEGASGAFGYASHAEGATLVGNDYEHASGVANNANKVSDNFGDSGNTLFTVGNGKHEIGQSHINHNVLDIRQDGSIYIPDIKASGEYYEKPMMLLQEAFLQSGDVITVVDKYAYDNKLAKLDGSDVHFDWNTKALGYRLQGVGHSQSADEVLTFGSGFTEDKTTSPHTLAVDMDYINANISGGSGVTSGEVMNIVSGYTYSKAVIDEKVAFGLPIYSGSGTDAITIGHTGNTASGDYSVAEGHSTVANNFASHAEGYKTKASGGYGSHAEGDTTTASGSSSHAEGYKTTASGSSSHAEGFQTIANNNSEHASGRFNISSKASDTLGDSGNTLFSVGNGLTVNSRHNAFEIRQSGDIYIVDTNASGTYYEKPMIKLQDALSQGGGITSGEVQTMIDQSISGKANSSDVYTKNETYTKTEVDNKFWCGTESEWSQISGSTQSGVLYLIY